MRVGMWSAIGGGVGAGLATIPVVRECVGVDVALILGSMLGSAAGAAIGLGAPESRMHDSMDAMFLGSMGAALASYLLTTEGMLLGVSSGSHAAHTAGGVAMAVMDGLMGGMIGGGAAAWWLPLRRVPRVMVVRWRK